jgi:hypothetical protein
MSSLFGKSVASTYKDLLQISNNNIGVDDAVRYIEDGEGTPSALGISSDTIGIRGHIIPQDNELYDLGNAEHKFRHLYLSDNTIYIGDTTFNVADIQAVKEIQTSATVPLSTVIESAESALQSGDVSLLDMTQEFQTEYGALKDTNASAVQPNTSPVFEDIQVTGVITGPEQMIIDPATVGDNTGNLIIKGDLTVQGETTTVNSTTIATSSLTIELAQGATNTTQADSAGIHVNGADATFIYSATTDTWTSNKSLDVPSIKQLNVDQTGTFNSEVIIGDAFNFKTNGSVGGELPGFGQAIVWNGAKWVPGSVASGGGGGDASEVPAPYRMALPAGQSTYTINFQQTYENIPAVATDLQIDGDLPIIPYVITDVTNSNFTIEFAETLQSIGYYMHVTFGGRDVIWQKDQLGQVYYNDGPVNMDGSLTVGGNLTVQGNTSVIDTANLSVKDHNIVIASGTPSQNLTGPVLGDAGVTWGNDDTVKLRYDSLHGFSFQGGDVGIGTTTPNAKLEVNGQIISNRRYMSDNSLELVSDWANTGDTSIISFKIDGQDVMNEKMRITSTGNVGIGTTNPSMPLSIRSSGADGIYFERGTTNIGQVDFSNNDLNFAATHNIRFSNPNANKYSFVGGNVGIGTTSPDHKLEVKTPGGIYGCHILDDQGVSLGGLFVSEQGAAADGLELYLKKPAGTTKVRVSAVDGNPTYFNAGNVGIGTTSPVGKLELDNGTSAVDLQFKETSTNFHRLGIKKEGPLLQLGEFNNAGDAFTNILTVDAEHDYVGIGTTDPSGKLNIHTSTAWGSAINEALTISNIGLEGNVSSAHNLGRIRWTTNTNDAAAIDAIRTSPQHGNATDLIFSTNTGGSNGITTEVMRLNSTGNVGIGTSSPTFKLDVSDPSTMVLGGSDDGLGRTNNAIKSSRVGGCAYTNSNNPVNMMMHVAGSTSSHLYFGWGTGSMNCPTKITFGTASNVTTSSSTAGNKRMFIHSNGNVSIGADNDSYKFYVAGSAYSTGTWGSSDDRLKHNEETIVGAIETLKKITPKKYIKTTDMHDADHDFDLDSDGKPVDENGDPVEHFIEAGVIAQEVLSVDELAFAVKEGSNDEDGNETPHALNYNSLFTYAIAAIQEQQTIIEDLKARIDTLENK